MLIDHVINKLLESRYWIHGKTIGLIGELGSGKTFFVKSLLEKYDYAFINQVSSPTFTICNEYCAGDLTVHHFDFYKLRKKEELLEIGFFESISNVQALNIIEWVNLFEEIYSYCDMLIKVSILDNDQHDYKILAAKNFDQ